MNQTTKRKFAKEIIILIGTVISIFILWGIWIGIKSIRTNQLKSDIQSEQFLVDSLEKKDFNRKLLFYFIEIEDETFLDRLYKDKMLTDYSTAPNFSAVIDSLKEYNGIFFASLNSMLVDKSKLPYYLQDIKYPEFEQKVKNSINIFDGKLPTDIISDITKRENNNDFENSQVDRFWEKAVNNPDLVFKKMSESYKKFYDLNNQNDFTVYLKKNKDTSYRKNIIDTKSTISSNKEKQNFWTKTDSKEILIYITLLLFGLLYVLRGLWLLLKWAIRTIK